MSSYFPGLGEKVEAEIDQTNTEVSQLTLTYRHWFVISMLLLFNLIIFGCIFLVAMDKIRWGI